MTTVRFTTTGIDRLVQRITRRSNFLGTGGVRDVLEAQCPALVNVFKEKINSFTPGSVRDLTEKYKVAKQKKWGSVYPILKASGSMFEGIRVRLVGPPYVFRLSFVGVDSTGVENSVKAEAHILGLGRNPKRDFTQIPSSFRTATLRAIGAALRGV